MIVCHCNVITDRMILEAIDSLLADDPWRQLTPGRIYARLGRRPRCGGCFKTVVALAIERSQLLQERDGLDPQVVAALEALLAAPTASTRSAQSGRFTDDYDAAENDILSLMSQAAE